MTIHGIQTISNAFYDNYNYGSETEPIPFFISELDEMEFHLHRGEPNAIMSRSGVGKTSLSLNIIVKNVLVNKKRFVLISQEMAKVPVIRRALAMTQGSEENKWREHNQKTEEQFEHTKTEGMEVLNNFGDGLYITDEIMTMTKLLEVINWAEQNNIDGIFCDYYQLVQWDMGKGVTSETDKLKHVSEEIKNRVKNTKIMFCWLSQVVEADKGPREDSIKQSRQLFHDAATVLNVFIDEDSTDLTMQIKKDRHNGNAGQEVVVGFNRKIQRIGEYKDVKIEMQSIEETYDDMDYRRNAVEEQRTRSAKDYLNMDLQKSAINWEAI